ncbi:unnamed protein product [Cuscuta campestris]|uniref:Aminoacyl-tRNA synthetase class II (D/K/N) domain-containing protein n=1 Tax=Cuscuta campestris TaxID=132261 RepID=A0A484KZY8_9ASTE|nr:unnamed protein product [Cuscuta campestris]
MCPTEPTGVMTPCTRNSKFTHRMILKTIFELQSDGGMGLIGQKAVIGGWVTFSREWRKPISSPDELDYSHPPIFSVLEVNDGSSPKRLQVLVDSRLESPCKVMPTGTCILVEGILQKASLQGGRQVQEIELVATEVLHLGTVEKNDNPLAKRCMPLQLLRDYPHLRTRMPPMGSVRRLHDSAFRALTAFFQDNGFLHVQLPVIHSSDNGITYEKFQVIVAENKDTNNKRDDEGKEDVGVSKCKCNEENNDNNNNEEMKGDDEHNSSQAEDKGKEVDGYSDNNTQDDIINHVVTKDFFPDEPMYLTAHGRLHLESQACALGNVYTYSPRFQAHKRTALMTSIEMWMVDAQMAFTRMEDVMDCAYDLLKFICKWVVDKSIEDVKHLSKPTGTTFVGWLQSITTRPFKRLSYDKAILVLNTILTETIYSAPTLKWGHRIHDGYAQFLVSTVYKRPLIIYDHPKQVKPFYVRLNDDDKTVASFDIYFEGGNVVSGYQSEERLDVLIARIEELGVSKQEYEWYLDLRRHGNTGNNSGFTLMLDALVLSLCGFNDVKDVVPFPQCPKPN